MNKTLKIVCILVISYGVYYTLQHYVFSDLATKVNAYVNNIAISYFIKCLVLGTPLFIGVGLIHNFKDFIRSLGLDKSIWKVLLFALICTSPMLIGYFIVFDFNSEITITSIITGAIIAAFIEELFFRGILFGQLFRFTKIGFIPSIVLGALIFASGHLYQSQEPLILIGVFLTTFIGAILFAWVYAEWNYNLWVSIFLHLFMNLYWLLFSVSNNAYGNMYANVFRILTIVLIIGLTIFYKRKKGIKFEINKNTILTKKRGHNN